MTNTTAPQSTAAIKAVEITATAERLGVKLEVRGDILTASKTFGPNDASKYSDAESCCWSVIRLLPRTGAGSTWGTTSDGVGGHSALIHGRMVLNVSGGSKRVLAAIGRMI